MSKSVTYPSGPFCNLSIRWTTLEDLRRCALQPERLVVEQAGEHTAQVERGTRLEGLVKGFETKAEQLVGLLVKSSVELEGTAESISSTAGRTNQQATTHVLDAAGQVSRQSESILDEVNRFITGVHAA